MPDYMLLLYADEGSPAEQEAREGEMPLWQEFSDSLREAGLLVGSDRLYPVESATTVRVRDRETQVTDGPFAMTKELLGGYYILRCADLDEAIKHAARVPLARYGSVEVRPLMEIGARAATGEEATAA